MALATLNISESREGFLGSGPRRGPGCWLSIKGVLGIVGCFVCVLMIAVLITYYLHPDQVSENVNGEQNNYGCPGCTTEETMTPVTTKPTDTGYHNYRLPGDVIPTHYAIKLRPNFYEGNQSDFYTNGTVLMHFYVKKPTNSIIVHKINMSICPHHLKVKDDQGQVYNMSKQPTYCEVRDYYTIHLEEMLTPGTNYSVFMKIKFPLKEDLMGLYLSQYRDTNGDNHYLVSSQLQATAARRVFPCLDEPEYKAVFSVTLERKAHLRSFSNTGVYVTNPLEGDWVADEYDDTPVMSTYILAFIVSDHQCLNTTTSNNKLVFVCSRPSYINQTRFALSIARPMQEFYENLFDIPYPLQVTVHIAIPDYSGGAMENWGLIVYQESTLLYDQDSSSAKNKQLITVIVAHELAHMWFGNLVTPSWWDDIWLNEGFATYMEYVCAAQSFPDWDMEGQMIADVVHNVFNVDSLVSSHPIYQHVYNSAEITGLFDMITYHKGASVIRMMVSFLGEKTFREGISEYLKERAYGAAHHYDLFSTLTKRATKNGQTINVTEVMSTWIQQLGYPVILLRYDPATRNIMTSQKHFLIDSSQQSPPSIYDYRWQVPVSVVTSDRPNFSDPISDWLLTDSGSIPTNSSSIRWMIGNAKMKYYYRVNYDTDNWRAIVEQLRTDHEVIHTYNRAQLIDDSFSLARSGDLDIEVPLEVTQYLVNETSYIPWRSATRKLSFLSKMLTFSGNFGYFQKYVRHLVEKMYSELGWRDDITTTHIKQRHRVIMIKLACGHGMQDCLENASQALQEWMQMASPEINNPVSPNLRSVTYCAGVYNGGAAEWDFLWEMYQSAASSSEKMSLLYALTCTREVHFLASLLDRALKGDGIRLQDLDKVVERVGRNPIGKPLAWNFIRQNWNKLTEWFGDTAFVLPEIVTSVTKGFSTDWELHELQHFKSITPNLATAGWAMNQAMEIVHSNINWRKQYEERITTWIKEKMDT